MLLRELAEVMGTGLGPSFAAVRRASCRAPSLPPGVVGRPELVDLLAATTPRAVVSIVAPAGYGKTTVAALWDRVDPRPFCWATLDHLDNDPAHLVAHIASALAESGLLHAEDIRFMSEPGRAPLTELVPMIAEVVERAEPWVGLIDDIQVLTDPAARAVLATIIDVRPTNAVVTLLSRTRPPRGTARRRLTDRVLELGPAELALGPTGSRLLFDAMGVTVDDDQLDDLLGRTEGWPAGLHLAGLALQKPGGGPAAVSGRNHLVEDFLVEEVLDGLDPELVEFLEEASLLSPMSAELLDDVLGREDSGQLLARAEVSGDLFLVGLDDDGRHFRFHRMLGELLAARMERRDPARTRRVHRRATDAMLERGDVDGAVRHAAAAGDRRRASALVEQHAVALASSGRADVLEQRLALLDPLSLTGDPDAAIARAWAAAAAGDVREIRAALADATTADRGEPMADGATSVASAAGLLAGIVGEGGLEGILRHTAVVTEAEPPDPWAPLARAIQASALIQMGRHAEARSSLEEALPGLGPLPSFEAGVLLLLAWLDLRGGDRANAAYRAEAGRRIAENNRLTRVAPNLVVWSVDALVAARSGDRARALADVEIAEEVLHRLGDEAPRSQAFARQHLTEALHALGLGAEARRNLDEAAKVLRRHPISAWLTSENERLADLLGGGPSGTNLAITPLTGAERRLLPYLATHLSLPQIAGELHVSRNTVKTHCVSVYRKLGVASRAEAVAEARRLGLIAA